MEKARRRATIASSVLAVAASMAACSGTDATEPADGLTNAALLLGNAPTMAPPGPLDEAQWGDDLLVVSTEPLPKDLVARIRAIEVGGEPGIAAMEQLSLGQVASEGRVLDVAAVDPGGFRRFAGADAGFQELWDRVADGEIAVPRPLARRLPLDEDDHLAVGTGEQVHDLHVGAYSTHQVGTIDVLVNEPWGKALGVPTGNALLLSTGLISPQAVRKEIEKVAPDLSISALDIVAETGIDPHTVQRVSIVGTFADAVGAFSYTLAGGRVTPAASWVRSHIVTTTVPILGTVTCNRYLVPQLRAALTEVQASGLAAEIHTDEYAGCYYPRFIAGSTTLSNHAFGLALDLNVPGNQRGTTGEMNRAVVAIFKRWGFAWGGDWRYTDPMHFELERIVDPG
jgi:hypothetical protein